LNWYDYGARHYDAALGRFTTNDRFAEKYHSMSPYQYGANNRSSKIIK
jgi:RHS repeat-associated protein